MLIYEKDLKYVILNTAQNMILQTLKYQISMDN